MADFDSQSLVNNITSIPIYIVLLIIAVGLIRKLVLNYLRKTVSVRAKVVDKYSSAYRQVGKNTFGISTDYIVAFHTGEKTIKFNVSVFLYDSVEKGETGTLRYKGSRLISFE